MPWGVSLYWPGCCRRWRCRTHERSKVDNQYFTQAQRRYSSEAICSHENSELEGWFAVDICLPLTVLQDCVGLRRLEKRRFIPEDYRGHGGQRSVSFFEHYVIISLSAALEEKLDEVSASGHPNWRR